MIELLTIMEMCGRHLAFAAILDALGIGDQLTETARNMGCAFEIAGSAKMKQSLQRRQALLMERIA